MNKLADTVLECLPEGASEEEIRAGMDNLLEGMPDAVRQWLLGKVQTAPSEIALATDQVADKINLATAYFVVRRLASLGKTLEFLSKAESEIFDVDRLEDMTSKERMSHYKALSKQTGDFLEFTRKFTAQNKEMFAKKSQADELAEIIREMKPEIVRELLTKFGKAGNPDPAQIGKGGPRKSDPPILQTLLAKDR